MYKRQGQKNVEINQIYLGVTYKDKATELNEKLGVQPCGIGELFSIIASIISAPNADLSHEDIFNALLNKSKKKKSLKDKYMNTFAKMFTNPGFKKIQSATEFPRTYKAMSLGIWEKEVALILQKIGKKTFSGIDKSLMTASRDDLIWSLILSRINRFSSIDSHIRYSYKDFFIHLQKSSFPFQISSKLIINEIKGIIDGYISDILNGELILEPIKAKTKEYNYRTRYIKAGDKTKKMLKDAALASIILESANSGKLKTSMLDIYLLLMERNINDNEIRNLLSKLYDTKRFFKNGSVTGQYHDIAETYVPLLIKLINNLSKDKRYQKFNNKIIKLLVSEIGGSDIHTQSISALSNVKSSKLESLDEIEFSSLNELIGLLTFTPKEQEIANEKMEKLSIQYLDDYDGIFTKIRNMKLGGHIDQILNNFEAASTEKLLEIPLEKSIGAGLKVAILPHDYALSLIAVGVNGVCIGPGSRYHSQHHRKECVNLIVYDDKAIYLWGLVIKANEPYKWFLNNFQGGLPNRYAKGKKIIKEEVLKILSEIGDIYMLNKSFNAISLNSELKEVEVEKLTLPVMRLDVNQAKDGTLKRGILYKNPKRENGLNLIK